MSDAPDSAATPDGAGPPSAPAGPAPTFSAIIPTHQARELVLVAIGSVLAQTDADFEIIVLDNGSTDGTSEAIAALDDPRITYRWQPDSGLPADSRNQALKLARGEWVAFLDADDTWYPDKLAWVRSAIDASPALDAICHDVRMMDPAGKTLYIRTYTLDDRPVTDQLLYRGNFLTTSAMTVRRQSIADAGGFDTRPDYFTVEDYDLWMRMAEGGARFAMINEVLGDYLLHPGGAHSRLLRHYDNFMRVFDDHALKRAAEGRLDVAAAVSRRTEARLAEVRELVRGGDVADAIRVLVRVPAERTDARRRYQAAAAATVSAS